MSAKVLLVDDHALMRSGIRTLFEAEEQLEARVTAAEAAVEKSEADTATADASPPHK